MLSVILKEARYALKWMSTLFWVKAFKKQMQEDYSDPTPFLSKRCVGGGDKLYPYVEDIFSIPERK